MHFHGCRSKSLENWVTFQAEQDVICVFSACPWDLGKTLSQAAACL